MEKIKCEICEEKFRNVGTHLKEHKIKPEQYKQIFPNAKILTEDCKSKYISIINENREKAFIITRNSEDFKRKMSNIRKNWIQQHPEWIQRRKIEMQGNTLGELNKGRIFTEEWKQKLRESRRYREYPTTNTSIEEKIKNELKKLNISFETQYPVAGQPDIAILGKKPIYIFADGCYWHCCEQCFPNGNRHIYKREYDKKITKELVDSGYIVLRFWEHEINKNLNECIEKILITIRSKHNIWCNRCPQSHIWGEIVESTESRGKRFWDFIFYGFIKVINVAKGYPAWNKGLTKDDPRVKSYIEKNSWIYRKDKPQILLQQKECAGKKYNRESEEYKKKYSEERNQKISETNKKIIKTEEWKQKIREKRLYQKPKWRDTSIERTIEKILKELNIRYKKHYPITGQPDFVIFIKSIARPDIAIFADGCYWHACPLCQIKNRYDFRREYDKKITKELVDSGYIVLRFWEHEINKNIEECKRKIIEEIKPKEVWGNSGWRVITTRAATSGGGVAEDGALPDTIKPTLAAVFTKPKNAAHNFGVSEIQQINK